MNLKNFFKKYKTMFLKILTAKFIIFFGLFLIRPPTVLIADAKMYYNLSQNPAEMFKPPGTPITKTTYFKPIGWSLFLYLFNTIYSNWIFWALTFNFIFSFLALFLLYKITNEKIMWLLFFYPYFLYHQNFPLEVSIFSFLIILSWYYFKKNNLLGNIICNLSSFFRVEGIILSFFYFFKRKNLKNFIIFLVISSLVVYTYGFFYVYLNFKNRTPFVAYPRIFIPFLIVLLIDYKKFFTKHFWKVLIVWVIFGGVVGYLKIFYEWHVL